MSLLRRIAISQGDKARQVAASQMLAAMDEAIVADWHKRLEARTGRGARIYDVQEANAQGVRVYDTPHTGARLLSHYSAP